MPCGIVVSCGISTPFDVLFPSRGKVAHALLTRPPLKHSGASSLMSPLDLHVLGTPPAFVLSQDQTLPFNPLSLKSVTRSSSSTLRNHCLVDCASFFSVSFSRFVRRSRERSVILSLSPLLVNTFFNLFLNLFFVYFNFRKSFEICKFIFII